MANHDSRACAARVLQRVAGNGESLSTALTSELAGREDTRARALVRELCFGSLRWHYRLTAIAHALLSKPLKARDLDVQCLLNVGLYQLVHTRVPEYAAVQATVEAAAALGKPWAKPLLNGVLRSFLRERTHVLEQVDSVATQRFAFPAWLLEAIQKAYPEKWPQILTASNQRPPLTLRVNRRRSSLQEYLHTLEAVDIAAHRDPLIDSAVTLEQAVDIGELPGFAAGLVSVQDAGAQLAATLLDCASGARVLDACAAPGGKTAHLLERAQGDLDLVALDIDPQRMARIEETLGRLGLRAQLIIGDARSPGDWWDARAFERILLDAPCTASGVIRRHPDIKLLRMPQDVARLRLRQAEMLEALWPLLATGGMLLYATCSILPAENDEQVQRFAQTHHDAAVRDTGVTWAEALACGVQIVPGQNGMDGFYYARLQKLG